MGGDRETSSLSEARRVAGIYMQTYLASTKRRSDLTDDELVRQAQSGDPGAFEILVERYSALLFLLTSRMVQDEHLAHDVLQHVFLQLYRSLPTLRPSGTLKAWLSQVARHRCFDELRRQRPVFFSEIMSVSDEDEFLPFIALPDPDPQPEEQVELRELLLDAIETLPSRYRAVVLLRYATQLSFREIGRALRIPEPTARTYFYQASKQLTDFDVPLSTWREISQEEAYATSHQGMPVLLYGERACQERMNPCNLCLHR
jgi:RNA polymerase sigma factor (sigma-70 family)